MSDAARQQPRLLIAAADAVVGQTLRAAGESIAASVAAVDSAAEALRLLRAGQADSAAIAQDLRDSDGLAFLLAARQAGITLPILFVASNAAAEEQALAGGATDCLRRDELSGPRLAHRLGLAMRLASAKASAAAAESALGEERRRWQQVMETTPDGLAILDGEGWILYTNPAAERLVGMTLAQLQAEGVRYGHPQWRYFRPDGTPMPDAERPMIRAYQRGEVVQDVEVAMVRRDGQRVLASLNAVPIKEPDGRICAVVVSTRDITVQRQAEQRLRDAEERYRTLFDSSPYGIMIVDPETGGLLEFNAMGCQQLGYTREEFARLRVSDVEAVETPQRTREHIRLMLEQGGDEFETRHRAKDGQLRDVLVSTRTMTIGGRVLICSVHRDVTEQNRLWEQLLHSQKMEAIGRLAGGVAHDFNNLLAVIGGYSEALARRLGEGHALAGHVAEIQRAAERGGSLTRQLLAFSRGQAIASRDLDLSLIVAEMREMLRRVISAKIDMRFELAQPLPSIHADPGQMEQVVLNLALNARDAMPHGGTLTIRTEALGLDEAQAALCALQPGRYVKLSVTDTGVGMDALTQARAFEPFFTTKENKGTGLGLSIVYGIAQQCGGNVAIHSRLGWGSCFEVFFPAEERP